MWESDCEESWALKNWCFLTVVLEKTLESPLDCKEIQPVHILKEFSPEYSLEGLRLKLKLQYFGNLMWRNDSFKKTLMLGKIEGGRIRGWDRRMASPTQWTWIWVNSGSWWWTETPGVLRSMAWQELDTSEWLNWTGSVLHVNFFCKFLWETLNLSTLRHYWNNVSEPERFQIRWLWKAANPTNSLPLGRVLVSPMLTRCIPISSYRSC